MEVGLRFCEKNFLHRELFNFKNTKLKNETNSFLKKERESKFYKFCDIKENSISNRSFHFQKTNIKKSCRVFILYITSTNLRSIDYNVWINVSNCIRASTKWVIKGGRRGEWMKKKKSSKRSCFLNSRGKRKKVFNDQLVVFATRISKRYKIKAFFSW